MKFYSILITAALFFAVAVSPATAKLVVAGEGTMVAGATNTTFSTLTVRFGEPVFWDSAVVSTTGTNDVVLSMLKVDMGYSAYVVSNQTVTGGSAAEYTNTTATALSAVTFQATKTAGSTNGTPTSVFVRVYGTTD